MLDLVGTTNGFTYQAVGEIWFPDAHGKRWVTRNDSVMPINFYVDGVVTPALLSVAPYDVPTAVTDTELDESESVTIDVGETQVILRYVGGTDTSATVVVNGVSFIVGDVAGSFVWDIGGDQEYAFTAIGDYVIATALSYTFTVTWIGTGSFYLAIEGFTEASSSSSSSSSGGE